MKSLKKILILTLVLVMALTSFACGKRDDLQGPKPEPPKPPVLVQRADIGTQFADNFMHSTPRDIIDAIDNGESLIPALLGDVMLGDLAKAYLGEYFYFDYYSDGQWRLSNGTKFDVVANSVFNYQFASGAPLALTEADLEMYGDTTVLSHFEELFSMAPATLSVAESDLVEVVNYLAGITVQELYDLTCGRFDFIAELLRNDVDLFIGALCELAGEVLVFDSEHIIPVVAQILKNTFNGSLLDGLNIDLSCIIAEVIPSLLESIPNEQASAILTFGYETIIEWLFESESELVIEDLLVVLVPELISYVQDEQASATLTFVYETVIEWLSASESEPAIEDLITPLFAKFYQVQIEPFITENGEKTLEQLDAEFAGGLIAEFLPDSVEKHFNDLQATLNEVVAQFEALSNGENQELEEILSEIEVSHLIDCLVTITDIPSECADLLNALFSGRLGNPILNDNVAVDELVDLIQSILEVIQEEYDLETNDAVWIITNELLDLTSKLYGHTLLKDIVDSTMALCIDDVIDAVHEFVGLFLLINPLEYSFEFLKHILDGSLDSISFDEDERAYVLINYVHDMISEMIPVNKINHSAFNELQMNYGDMSILEFISMYFEEIADLSFEEIIGEFIIQE